MIPSVFLLDAKRRNQDLLGTQGHVRVSKIEGKCVSPDVVWGYEQALI